MYAIKNIFISVILSLFMVILFHYGFSLLKESFTESKTKDVLGLSKKQYDSFKKTLDDDSNVTNIDQSKDQNMELELKNYLEDLKISK